MQQPPSPADAPAPPADGVLISGLWLDGARWDAARGCLAEPEPGATLAPLPPVHFRPQVAAGCGTDAAPDGCYACPLYKTSARAGALSTTGQSTNFVLCVALPGGEGGGGDKWVLQGVALLCQRDD